MLYLQYDFFIKPVKSKKEKKHDINFIIEFVFKIT